MPMSTSIVPIGIVIQWCMTDDVNGRHHLYERWGVEWIAKVIADISSHTVVD